MGNYLLGADEDGGVIPNGEFPVAVLIAD